MILFIIAFIIAALTFGWQGVAAVIIAYLLLQVAKDAFL